MSFSRPKKGKKVVILSPPENAQILFRHLRSKEQVDPNSNIHPAPNMVQVKSKREQDGRNVMLDFYVDGQFGSAKGSFLALLIDARAVVFVASNSQSDSLDKLTTMLATSSMIPGRKFLVIADEVPAEASALKAEYVDSWSKSRGCQAVIHIESTTGTGVDDLMQRVATSLA